MNDKERHAAEPDGEPLTRREREVLALLAQGHSAPEIADQLTLALSTVKWHLEHVYGKLGANSKRQALARAQALGLLAASAGTAPAQPPATKHNLPVQVTRFFGRENDMARIRERLTEWRLVTLTGSGGVGKTRLALRVAEDHLGACAEGVWFTDLAPLSDPALVAPTVAAALGVRDQAGRPVQESLTAFLRERQVLLVLDNCEHLLVACAGLAEALLRLCPHVRILATSREALAIAGEAVYRVPSLPFPDPDHLPALESLSDYDTINLFVDRARALVPGYQAAAHNAVALARICERLDGIPLAIEMAAARINTLSAEQLAGRLDDAFRLLTSGSRTALPRQQTLRGMLNWSFELLKEGERLLLQRLSVFAGGCTLEAAEAICSGEGLEAGQVLDLLASLVAKSLILADRRPGEEARYRLLEMVRQFARERLDKAGESDLRRTRHRDYFLTFAKTNIPKLGSKDRLIWTRRIAVDRENLRHALEWSFSDLSDPEAGPRLILLMYLEDMMSDLWPHQEGMEWYRKGIALCQNRGDISPRLHAALLSNAAGWIALNDPSSALILAKQSVEISRGLGPAGKDTLMWCLSGLGWRYMEDLSDVASALAPYAEMEAIFNEIGPDRFSPDQYRGVQAWNAYIKAKLAEKQGQYQAAKLHADESLRLFEATGDRWSSIEPHTLQGTACLSLGEFDHARAHFLEALRLNDESGRRFESHLLLNLGMVDFKQGNLDQARAYFQASISQASKLPDYNIVASALGHTAAVLAQQGRASEAATLSGASQAIYARQARKPWEEASLDALLPGWRDEPDCAVISKAIEAGQAMTADEAVAYALGVAA